MALHLRRPPTPHRQIQEAVAPAAEAVTSFALRHTHAVGCVW